MLRWSALNGFRTAQHVTEKRALCALFWNVLLRCDCYLAATLRL